MGQAHRTQGPILLNLNYTLKHPAPCVTPTSPVNGHQNARSWFGRKGCQPAGAGLAPVPLEYSIVSLTRVIASRINVVMVCLPGAAQDRSLIGDPASSA
jgi:hypothetical protein